MPPVRSTGSTRAFLPAAHRMVSMLSVHTIDNPAGERPPGWRAVEVVMLEREGPARPDADRRVHRRVEEVDPIVDLILRVAAGQERRDAVQVGDHLGGPLQDDGIGGIFGRRRTVRVGAQVTDLPGAQAAGEPQRCLMPHRPDRHHVRPPVRPYSGDPVVPRGGQPLLRPRPRQEATALVRADNAVPRHVGPGRRRSGHAGSLCAGCDTYRARYSRSRPREMIVFWISEVPSPMSRNGASRMSRSISYSLE